MDRKGPKDGKPTANGSEESEHILLQTIIDAIPDVIGIQDPNHRIIRYNEAGYKLLGMTPEEVYGKECFKLIGKDRPCNICATSKAYVSKVPMTVTRYEDALGMWLDVRAYPVLDEEGELIYIIEHLRDITKEKEAEIELKFRLKFENLLSSISANFMTQPLDSIDQCIDDALKRIGELVDADRSYVFLYKENGRLMDNVYEWCGEGIESAIHGLKDLEVSDFHLVERMLDDRKEVRLRKLSELPPEASADREILEKQGIISLVLVPMFLGGRDIGFLGFDSVRYERSWSEENIRLLKLVGEIIASGIVRKKTQDELKTESRTFEFYLELLGHDIGNLHQGIFASLQIAGLGNSDPQMRSKAISRAEEITKRSMSLVKSVLLLSKLRSHEPELMPIRICDSIEQSMDTIHRVFSDREIDFHMTCAKECSPVLAEPILSEVFFNLLHNGIKFQDDHKPVLEVEMMESDGTVEVHVCDHGPGIPDGMKRDMFGKFRPGGNGSRTGLGLFLVKTLVERYNGTIEVADRIEGAPSKGARFIVRIPRAGECQ
ncbi:MAG: ATP-binding protein [Thermoplasmatota archaeon]